MKPYGINGEHEKIGSQVKDAEFRGYMMATQEQLKESIEKLDLKIETWIEKHEEEIKEKEEKYGNRIQDLENFKTQALAIIAGVAAIMTVLWDSFWRITGLK